jgi:hypothetical protein
MAASMGVRLADEAFERQRTQIADKTARLNAQNLPIQLAFDEYHRAVDADTYRITSKKFDVGGKDGPAMNWSKSELGIELAPPAVVRANVSRITERAGESVYYTPISARKWHPQIDDLKPETLAALKADGYKPAAVLESSPGNFHAIFNVPKPEEIDGDVARQAANNVVSRLNEKYGDPNFKGVDHTHRVPGAPNRKPQHQRSDGTFPIVTLIEGRGGVCPEVTTEIAAEAATLAASAVKATVRIEPKPPTPGDAASSSQTSRRLYDAHRASIARALKSAITDDSRADYMVGVRMRAVGHSREEIEAAIAGGSPALDARKCNVPDYLARTLDAIHSPKATREIEGYTNYHSAWRRIENRALGVSPPKNGQTKVVQQSPTDTEPPAMSKKTNQSSAKLPTAKTFRPSSRSGRKGEGWGRA